MPYETECPACGGYPQSGCDVCGDTGILKLTECPKKAIPADVWEVMDYAELYRKGLPPEPGGALDQAACFTAACRFVWGEQERMKTEIRDPRSGIRDTG